MNKPTILVIDDEAINVDLIVGLLSHKYNVKVGYNGIMALKILERVKPDLILLDIEMPIMNGYEVAEKLKNDSRFNNIPFIFLTSKVDSSSIIKGFQLGAVDYITKPFNSEELKVRVLNHVRTHQLQIEVLEQQKFIKMIVDTQPNIIMLTDGRSAEFVNKTFLNFFGCSNLDMFLSKYGCISQTFIENEKYFHLGKLKPGENWIKHIQSLPQEQRVVCIMSADCYNKRVFNISINIFKDKNYIINFNDISQTVHRQIELENKTTHDNLTNVFNREFFEQNYEKIINNNKMYNCYTALVMIDIDHFKNINDTFGHDVGDTVLKELTDLIKKSSRNDDVLVRWGGEEFIMLLKVDSLDILKQVVEHLRLVVQDHTFSIVKNLTCSFGATIYKEGDPIKKTIKIADEALYDAKANGRNMIVVESYGL